MIGKVTERSFYPALMEVIQSAGGTGVQEICYNSVPDIVFNLGSRNWILSVKIGDNNTIIKDAFLQYLRHKEESNISFGILLLLPESVRKVQPSSEEIKKTTLHGLNTTFIDAGTVKEEIRNQTFPRIIDFLKKEVLLRLEKKQHSYYSLHFVVSMLQEQVVQMMRDIKIDETDILKIITDQKLLMDIGHLKEKQAQSVSRFLASFILMSQILFLRLFYAANPNIFTDPITPVSHLSLRKAFRHILKINYKPIYKIDVLDAIPDKFLKDTFDLLWGLQIENVRHDLPGRIFHELMPADIRKMLAAFYTRPIAADILTKLAIKKSDETVFDPAGGSGTILISAYKRKFELHYKEGMSGNPHKRFCEEEIFGADIMPFAVHLISANLASMDVSTTIKRTQIVQGDSLKLTKGHYHGGLQTILFPNQAKAKDMIEEDFDVPLNEVDVILMNPPFTKVERGIRDYVDMSIFYNECGGEVGLWGHFIALSNYFLSDDGTFAGVIPINILRGRESSKIRDIFFNKWTPLYILKSTNNYGFSEWAEYRDVLLIAKKREPQKNTTVKVCFIKKDLTKLTADDVSNIECRINKNKKLRSTDLDIDIHKLSDLASKFQNLMWFCGGIDLSNRDKIITFLDKFSKSLKYFPEKYFSSGYRPYPKGVSKFLFLTRHSDDSRVEESFLRFSEENDLNVKSSSPMGTVYTIEKSALLPSLRTPVGLKKMDITYTHDFIFFKRPTEFDRIHDACGFKAKNYFNWNDFWNKTEDQLKNKKTKLAVVRRVNPFSPSSYMAAFFCSSEFSPSDTLNIIQDDDENRCKAVCVLLNSILFYSNFFLLKEESTGRYIDVRSYDLYLMKLFPNKEQIGDLVKIYDRFSKIEFPSLQEQFDTNFEERYKEYWQKDSGKFQTQLWNYLEDPIKPSTYRLEFDKAICKALNMSIQEKELVDLYNIFVQEMIIIRRLKRD